MRAVWFGSLPLVLSKLARLVNVSDAAETPAIASQNIKTIEAVLWTEFRVDIPIPPKSFDSGTLNFPDRTLFPIWIARLRGATTLRNTLYYGGPDPTGKRHVVPDRATTCQIPYDSQVRPSLGQASGFVEGNCRIPRTRRTNGQTLGNQTRAARAPSPRRPSRRCIRLHRRPERVA